MNANSTSHVIHCKWSSQQTISYVVTAAVLTLIAASKLVLLIEASVATLFFMTSCINSNILCITPTCWGGGLRVKSMIVYHVEPAHPSTQHSIKCELDKSLAPINGASVF